MQLEMSNLTRELISAAIATHRHLGPGLLESAYQACLAHELKTRGVAFAREHPVPIRYGDVSLDCGYRADLLIENALIAELKSARRIEAIHRAQLLTYMRLADIRVGLLINFNVTLLKDGIVRMVL